MTCPLGNFTVEECHLIQCLSGSFQIPFQGLLPGCISWLTLGSPKVKVHGPQGCVNRAGQRPLWLPSHFHLLLRSKWTLHLVVWFSELRRKLRGQGNFKRPVGLIKHCGAVKITAQLFFIIFQVCVWTHVRPGLPREGTGLYFPILSWLSRIISQPLVIEQRYQVSLWGYAT